MWVVGPHGVRRTRGPEWTRPTSDASAIMKSPGFLGSYGRCMDEGGYYFMGRHSNITFRRAFDLFSYFLILSRYGLDLLNFCQRKDLGGTELGLTGFGK